MQRLINEYFTKICKGKFIKHDDETIIGRVKDVIENLKQQSKYVKNQVGEEDAEFITKEVKDLVKEIKTKYSNKHDVIKMSFHPMAGFFVLVDKESLLEELEEYYNEME